MRYESIEGYILHILMRRPNGMSAGELWHRIEKNTTYSLQEFNEALYKLQNANILGCSNKVWWPRYRGHMSPTNEGRVSDDIKQPNKQG